jgi:tricorn protease-like protein
MPLFGDRKPFPVVTSQFAELNARFSPDGRWIAFQSSESGQSQVYVQPFPATGGKFMVSKDGGFQPAWRRDGKELFFVSPDARMMSALIDATGEFHAGIPTPLFPLSINLNSLIGGRQYGVTKDGTRFLVNAAQQTSRVTPLTVVVNWLDAVQK